MDRDKLTTTGLNACMTSVREIDRQTEYVMFARNALYGGSKWCCFFSVVLKKICCSKTTVLLKRTSYNTESQGNTLEISREYILIIIILMITIGEGERP